eukprot:scaffold75247_cov70-Phaeocystis_antarctica.AAC.3
MSQCRSQPRPGCSDRPPSCIAPPRCPPSRTDPWTSAAPTAPAAERRELAVGKLLEPLGRLVDPRVVHVVRHGVAPDEVDLLRHLSSRVVLVALEPLQHSAQVHRALDDRRVVGYAQRLPVHRVEEGRRVLVLADLLERRLARAPLLWLQPALRTPAPALAQRRAHRQTVQSALKVIAQLRRQLEDVRALGVECARVGPHQPDVVGPVAGGLVAATQQLGLDSAQVHRVLDHLGILRQLERLPVDGHQKGACPGVPLQRLQHTEALLGVLICLAAWRELLLLARLLHHCHLVGGRLGLRLPQSTRCRQHRWSQACAHCTCPCTALLNPQKPHWPRVRPDTG